MNGRSKIDAKTIEEFWKYISHDTELLQFRTEFAGDTDRIGVAISRHSQILVQACQRIVNNDLPLVKFLDATKFTPVKREAQSLLQPLSGLVATEAQKNRKRRRKEEEQSQASMMCSIAVGKVRSDVERDARLVYQWLAKQDSPLRDFLSAASDGGTFFTANCHHKSAVGFKRHRILSDQQGLPGVGENDFVNAAVARLCD